MGMRPAARLDVDDVPRTGEIGAVEDPDAAQPVMAHRVGHALRAAIGPAVQRFTGDEEEVAIDRHVALRSGTDERLEQLRHLGVADVPYLEAVKVALDDEIAAERQVRIDKTEVARHVAVDELG